MRRLAAALAVLALAIGVGGELVGADAPVKQGWWSRWQSEPVPGVTVPPPPTGDDGGLTVAMGADGPEAVAAMYFTVEAPVDGSLYLAAAPRKKEGTPGLPVSQPPPSQAPDPDTIVLPPGTGVLACQALSGWERESNGPWSKVPTWSTTACAPGTLTADGTGMFWVLSASMQDVDDNYDVVLVPVGRPDGAPTPFMVNFASPGADALVTEDAPEPEPSTTTSVPDTTTTTAEELVAVPVAPPPVGPVAAAPTEVPRRSPPTSLLSAGPRRRPPLPFRFPDTRPERIMAVSVLLAMAAALWWVGGSPARMPRLIGAVAGRSPTRVEPPEPLRGVGRFARPRSSGRPPRL